MAGPYWVMAPMSLSLSILWLKPAYLLSWFPFFFFICTVILTGTAIFSKVLLKDIFEKYFGPNNTQVRRKRQIVTLQSCEVEQRGKGKNGRRRILLHSF